MRNSGNPHWNGCFYNPIALINYVELCKAQCLTSQGCLYVRNNVWLHRDASRWLFSNLEMCLSLIVGKLPIVILKFSVLHILDGLVPTRSSLSFSCITLKSDTTCSVDIANMWVFSCVFLQLFFHCLPYSLCRILLKGPWSYIKD